MAAQDRLLVVAEVFFPWTDRISLPIGREISRFEVRPEGGGLSYHPPVIPGTHPRCFLSATYHATFFSSTERHNFATPFHP